MEKYFPLIAAAAALAGVAMNIVGEVHRRRELRKLQDEERAFILSGGLEISENGKDRSDKPDGNGGKDFNSPSPFHSKRRDGEAG